MKLSGTVLRKRTGGSRGQSPSGASTRCARRLGQAILEHHATAQCLKRGSVGFTLHLHQIGLLFVVTWIGQMVREMAVIGQQQQPFRIEIQPTCGIDIRWQTEAGQRRTRRNAAISELAKHAIGFVEGDQHVAKPKKRKTRLAAGLSKVAAPDGFEPPNA